MNTLPEVQEKELISLGDMPRTAEEIFDYVRTSLVAKATPLKVQSMNLHNRFTFLPVDWQLWNEQETALASALYDEIANHEKSVRAKGTELDTIRDKAEKLKKGILRALDDIMGDLPADKEVLLFKIRKWRNREEEKAREEARRQEEAARKAEEERRLAEALALEEEAAKLKAIGQEAIAEEVRQEAAAVIEEEVFIPPPQVKANIPTGGPRKMKVWKYQVVDFSKLPDKYKMANDKLIGADVRNWKDKADIPGVKVWSE